MSHRNSDHDTIASMQVRMVVDRAFTRPVDE